MPLIHSGNYRNFIPRNTTAINGLGRGYIPRDYDAQPYGSLEYADRFEFDRIPRNEWTDRIEQMDKDESSCDHVREYNGLETHDQSQTNYCWMNGVCSAMEIVNAERGNLKQMFSPASAAARIKNFRNVGGWGGDAVEWIIANGINNVEEWPHNAIDRQYDTPANRLSALKNTIKQWIELPERDIDALMTCLFDRIPVPIGLSWWSHLVCAIRPVLVKPNVYGVMIWNSWGNRWGDNGRGILTLSKATPDDAVAPIAIARRAA